MATICELKGLPEMNAVRLVAGTVLVSKCYEDTRAHLRYRSLSRV
jgi:hypothetical protein